MKPKLDVEPIESQPGSLKEAGLDNRMDWETLQFVLGVIIIVLLILSPMVIKSPYYLNMLIVSAIFAYVGISWNIVAGFAGQLFIGFTTFVGLGAYTTIILLNEFSISPWFGFLVSAFVAATVGIFVSFLTLRYGLKLDYLALFTLALMSILGILFNKFELAGGASGAWISFSQESFAAMSFRTKPPYLYIVSFMLFIGLTVQYLVYKSKLGQYLLAIREDEDAAAALGINTSYYKTMAVIVGAALAGAGGGFYAIYTRYISPFLVFGFPLNVEFLVAPIIGGRGTIIGPILGSFLNKPLSEFVRGAFSADRGGVTLIIYGLSLMLFILFLPNGIAGVLRRIYIYLSRKNHNPRGKTKLEGRDANS